MNDIHGTLFGGKKHHIQNVYVFIKINISNYVYIHV